MRDFSGNVFGGNVNNSGNITIGSQIGAGAILTGTKVESMPTQTSENDAVLKELRELQEKFSKEDAVISELAANLQKAIQEQNQPKILEIVKKLTTGVIGNFLAGEISDVLKQFFQSVIKR